MQVHSKSLVASLVSVALAFSPLAPVASAYAEEQGAQEIIVLAGEDEQPADEQPADEQPADEQPAEEQPAEEQPAEELLAEELLAEEQPADGQPAEDEPEPRSPKVKDGVPDELGGGVLFMDEYGSLDQSVVDYEELTSSTGTTLSGDDMWYVAKQSSEFSKRMRVEGDVKLIICDSNGVNAHVKLKKGLELAPGAKLTIYGQDGVEGLLEAESHNDKVAAIAVNEGSTLIVNGSTVEATAKTVDAAGIGGNKGKNAGTITINAGEVIATSKKNGAGIGGGMGGNGGTITINGGEVIAVSKDEDGAAIGGGDGGGSGKIAINGGRVTATSKASSGPGIGSGCCSMLSGQVTINGGRVEAQGGNNAAGLGGGRQEGDYAGVATGCDVAINGGTVIACGGDDAAGIGAGEYGVNGSVLISGGTVTATGGSHGAGIGCGNGKNDDSYRRSEGQAVGEGHDIVISGGNVTAEGGSYAAGIGGSEHMCATPVAITGGSVFAKAGSESAGIGGANKGAFKTVKISDATVTAVGADKGAGIGGGDGNEFKVKTLDENGKETDSIYPSYERIEIGGDSVVKAFGGGDAAGIGTGNECKYNPGTIAITGGDVLAVGGTKDVSIAEDGTPSYGRCKNGAGIGGGDLASGGAIEISGGHVKALGALYAAGIGGGEGEGGGGDSRMKGSYEYISITGPETEVEARTVGEGAGIGSGNEPDCDEKPWSDGIGRIYIGDGAHVTAVCDGKKGAGIGSGDGDRNGANTVTIYGVNTDVYAQGGANAAGIGGGNNDRSYFGINILDFASVRAKAGKNAECIGLGKDDLKRGYPHQVQLYDEAMVTSDGNIAKKDERGPLCHTKDSVVQVSPCQHAGASYEYFSDRGHMLVECPYCAGRDYSPEQHEHHYGKDGHCVVCGFHTVKCEGASLVPGSRLAMKFAFTYPPCCENPHVSFKIGGKLARTVESSEGVRTKGDQHEYTFYLSPLELGEPVTATLHCGDSEYEQTCTAADCAKRFSERTEWADRWDGEVEHGNAGRAHPDSKLAHEYLNLGHYLQKWLATENGWEMGREFARVPGHDDGFLEREMAGEWDGITPISQGVDGYAFYSQIKGTGVHNVDCTLTFGATTTVNVFFETKPGAAPLSAKAIFGDRAYEAQEVADNLYCVQVKDVALEDFDEAFEITGNCDGEFRVAGSPLAYLGSVWNSSRSKREAKEAVAAMYHCYFYASWCQEWGMA